MTREPESASPREPTSDASAGIPVGDVVTALFSGDGRRIVFFFEIGVWLLDAPSGRGAPVIHRGVMAEGGAISESGDRFVAVDYAATTIHRVSIDDEGRTTNRPLRCEPLLDLEASLLCELSPDGEWLALGTEDGNVTVMPWESDEAEHSVHVEGLVGLAFDGDGRTLWLLGDEDVPLPLSGDDKEQAPASAEDRAVEEVSDGDPPYRVRGERALFIEGPPERDGFMITVRTGSRTLVLGPPGGVALLDVLDAGLSWDSERVWIHAMCEEPAGDSVLVYNADTGDWLGVWQGLVNEEAWQQLGTAPINPFGFDDGESVAAASPAPRAARGVAEDVIFDGHSSLLLARLASGVVGRADARPLSSKSFDDRDGGERALRVLAGLEAAAAEDKVARTRSTVSERARSSATLAVAAPAGESIPTVSAEEYAQAEILAIERTIATQEEEAPAPPSTVWLRVVWVALALFAAWLLSR